MGGAGDQTEPGGQQGWAPEIEEIRRRQDAAQAMGGPQKVARQGASGRLTVRERIDRLADPGTFAEIGALTGFGDYDAEGRLVSVLPANFVAGTARIDGRPVMIGADDFTVRGGSGDAAFRAELEQAADPAAEIERIRRTLAGVSSPFRTAERFGVQDLIDPRDSRPLLCAWVRDAYRVLPELTGRPRFGTRP